MCYSSVAKASNTNTYLALPLCEQETLIVVATHGAFLLLDCVEPREQALDLFLRGGHFGRVRAVRLLRESELRLGVGHRGRELPAPLALALES